MIAGTAVLLAANAVMIMQMLNAVAVKKWIATVGVINNYEIC